MTPSLIICGIPFFDTPSEIEGAPYWVDLWADINGYKIGLQIKPQTYSSSNAAFYMRKAKSSEEKGHIKFTRDYGGAVFTINPQDGCVSDKIEHLIQAEIERLKDLPPR